MVQFTAEYARESISQCLRGGEALQGFTEAQDVNDLPQTGMWAGAGITWIGLNSSRIMEVHSANGQVFSTPWTDIENFGGKGGLFGGRLTYTLTDIPDSPTTYKVDKAFVKLALTVWREPKTVLAAESTTVHVALYERLDRMTWFCDSCGQPCGSPDFSATPNPVCNGCLRSVSGVRSDS